MAATRKFYEGSQESLFSRLVAKASGNRFTTQGEPIITLAERVEWMILC